MNAFKSMMGSSKSMMGSSKSMMGSSVSSLGASVSPISMDVADKAIHAASGVGAFTSGLIGSLVCVACSVPAMVYSGKLFTFINGIKDVNSDCSRNGVSLPTIKKLSLGILVTLIVCAVLLLGLPVLSMSGVLPPMGLPLAIPSLLFLFLVFIVTMCLFAVYWNVCNRCKDNHKCSGILYTLAIIGLFLGIAILPPLPLFGIPLGTTYVSAIACASYPDKCTYLIKKAVAAKTGGMSSMMSGMM